MKRVFVGLFIMLALSGFVFAVGSEVNANFAVDISEKEVSDYVSSGSMGDYFGYFILALVILVVFYFVFREKKSLVHKEVSRSKKVIKRVGKRK